MHTPARFKWDDLQVLLEIIRVGSFSKAAQRLKITQSTVSRRIAALEEALDAPLFQRHGGPPRPTAAALALRLEAEKMESAAHQVARIVEEQRARPEGLVRVAMLEAFGGAFIASFEAFREAYPEIQIEVKSGNAVLDLNRREADIALRTVRPTQGDLVYKRVIASGYGAYAHPSYVEAHRGAPLSELDWLVWGLDAPYAEADWMATVAPRPRLHAHSGQVLLAAASAGLGVTLCAHAYAPWFGLVEIPCDVPDALHHEMWLVTHRTLRYVPKIAALWGHLEGVMRELVAGPGAPRRLLRGGIYSHINGPSR